jgi:hypothetical protein
MSARLDIAAVSATAAQPSNGHARRALRIFVLGATGRTGAPFVVQALARGHTVSALVRDQARLPAGAASNPSMHVARGDLGDAGAIARSWTDGPPDIVVLMLSSERPPHKAVSTGTSSLLEALRGSTAVGAGARPVPFISIASWGLGPTASYIGCPGRTLVGIAKRTFWAGPFADFEAQLAMVDEATAREFIRPTIILPPILTNGPKSDTYLSGEAHLMKDVMGITRSAARASIADLALKLGETAASGGHVPAWVAICESHVQ